MPSAELPLRVQVLLSAGRALWEVPTPPLRAVAVAWDNRWLRPRFVYDAAPNENERELVSLFGTYLVSDFTSHKVEEQVEVLAWPGSLGLHPGEEWVYRRYEPDHE